MELVIFFLFIVGVFALGYKRGKASNIIENTKKFEPVKKVNTFAKEVAIIESGKVNLSIAQISEVLKCINNLTNSEFYKFIKRGY